MTAFVEFAERPSAAARSARGAAQRGTAASKLHVVLCDTERPSTSDSVNAELLLSGLARVVHPKGAKVGIKPFVRVYS